MPKLSAVITCFNNEDTIRKCVDSLSFADEIIVLDSFSNDKTLKILNQLPCSIHQQKFKGFWKQKQDAINLCQYDWIILLDSDEYLTNQAQTKIRQWKKSTPQFSAYQLPRREWVFWQWSHPLVHQNKFVRLFDKRVSYVSHDLVHESIKTTGKVSSLDATIMHYGETSVEVKIEKINKYALLAAQQKHQQGKTVGKIKLKLYPIWYFFRQYLIRRQIFNGKAGFINAKLNTRYATMKYAKLYDLIHKGNRNKKT